MALMPDQLKAAEDFEDWLNNSSTQTGGLWASAGFGKSWCAKHLIDEIVIKNSNYTPLLASMTHSAVQVLADFVSRDVRTLHSIMGWIPYVDKDTGEEGISTPKMRDRDADPRLNRSILLIVDEAGLMGHDELRLLLQELEETGARVLFIGDNKQCFPVIKEGQKLCIPAYEYSERRFELTTPKRVDEGDMIYKLSLAYRAAVDGAPQPKLKTALNSDKSGKGVRHVDDIEELAYKAFKAGVRDGNTRNIKVLAYTNRRCLTLNRKIRKKIMGLKDPTPIAGEEMVANTTIQSSTGEDCLIRNNEKVIVKSVEKTSSYGLDGAFIQFTRMDEEQTDVEEIIFVPSSPGKLADRLKKMANDAKAYKANGFDTDAQLMWRAFFSLKDGCADIRFTYAMTVNKAQGTTLKHALVDLCDIDSCRDYEQKTRMAYTAVTRATDYATIEGELT
jgi:exodeoxyribonuclease-5